MVRAARRRGHGISLMGGREAVLRDLTGSSTKPSRHALNDYYNHASEPVTSMPFLFNARLGRPWQTRNGRHICEKATPTRSRGSWATRTPDRCVGLVRARGRGPASRLRATRGWNRPSSTIELRLDPAYAGGTFTVVARRVYPSNVYIQRAVLNGGSTASHRLRRHCGRRTLELLHGRHPNARWGI